MDRETIEAFEKAHQYILPESYINFLLILNITFYLQYKPLEKIYFCHFLIVFVIMITYG